MVAESTQDKTEIRHDEVLQQGEVVSKDHIMACIPEVGISIRITGGVPLLVQVQAEID